MDSIGKITEDLINRSPFLREAITDNLINISSLARKLKPEIEEKLGKPVKEGAIVMTIKRMSPGLYYRLNMKITNMMSELGDFLVRSNLSDFTYENTESLKNAQSEFINLMRRENDNFYTISQGLSETTFIVSASQNELVSDFFKNEKLKAHNDKLASVTVKLPTVNTEIYGVYYYILKQLAWEGINIVQVVSTSNEFSIVVNQNEIDSAFKILMDLKRMN
jgi:hypothetical protein